MSTIVILATAACVLTAQANPILFATGPTQLSGGTVNATASFAIDSVADTVTISILNLQNNPITVAQLISGLSFTLGHFASSVPAPSIVSERAQRVRVDHMGRMTDLGPTTDTDWKILPDATAGLFDLCTICNGSGDPDELLIGAPSASRRYTAANGSMAGNNSHNPFLLATGAAQTSTPVWTVRINGISPSTYVAAVTFRFGTTYDAVTAPGKELTETPEPGAIALLAGGFAILVTMRPRKAVDIRKRS